MAREGLAHRLYTGDVSYDFIGRRRWWYIGSGIVILVAIASLAIAGLNPSIDFKGGAQFQGPLNGHSIQDVTNAVNSAGVSPSTVETTGSGSAKRFQIETKTLTETPGNDQVSKITDALSSQLGIKAGDIDSTTVGATWGSQITHKAVIGLIVFLVAVIAYLSIRFEWKMALAAIIALLHDLVITAGIYSLSGFTVSPSTVIALLTILGYSLYDTVVVFDKVRENTASITGGSRMTFSEAANLGVNQTLVRSINTSIIALLPVIGLLGIGVGLLGAGSLQDLALALLIGLASGAYSSIFIAPPLLCDFKEREPAYQQLAKRVAVRRVKEAREAREPKMQPAVAGAPLPNRPVQPERPSPAEATEAEPAETGDGVTGDLEPDRPRAEGPRVGARPGQPRRRSGRGGRPGGRGGRSRKRR
ncbi:MAG TPA: protein translocase subunit SecF [Mycobacteriales bacterium]|nr:protein translocase subunit SecF [Mycobacteriales bacterium]